MSSSPSSSSLASEPLGLSSVEDKALRSELIRVALPACQPQEGSPANTFTGHELAELQAALPGMQIGPRNPQKSCEKPNTTMGLQNLKWEEPCSQDDTQTVFSASPQDCDDAQMVFSASPQDCDAVEEVVPSKRNQVTASCGRDWHGAPRFPAASILPRAFREQVRAEKFVGPTNGQCPGFLQCNLVVLPQGQHAFDFLLFCQRNPKACPLIEVCDVGSPFPTGVAEGADLRTDVPKYSIYRNGKLEKETTNVVDEWPEDSVAFLIGCSFSYDGALMDAGIPLRSFEQNKNVPMYKTNLKCRPAGSLQGNVVVSMKPIPSLMISKHVEITSKYSHAHGGPVSIANPAAIGIDDLQSPQWGDPIDVRPDEVPVFHACGVTPQSVLMDSKVPFAITHSAGYMFVTDLPSDMGV